MNEKNLLLRLYEPRGALSKGGALLRKCEMNDVTQAKLFLRRLLVVFLWCGFSAKRWCYCNKFPTRHIDVINFDQWQAMLWKLGSVAKVIENGMEFIPGKADTNYCNTTFLQVMLRSEVIDNPINNWKQLDAPNSLFLVSKGYEDEIVEDNIALRLWISFDQDKINIIGE